MSELLPNKYLSPTPGTFRLSPMRLRAGAGLEWVRTQMKQEELSGKAIALIGIGVAMLVGGMLDNEALFPGDVQRTIMWQLATLGTNVMVTVLTFMWYREDAVEEGFQRTRLWDIGIILATVVIVLPSYLYRSRVAQRRLGALGRLSAFVFAGMLLPYIAGYMLAYVLAP